MLTHKAIQAIDEIQRSGILENYGQDWFDHRTTVQHEAFMRSTKLMSHDGLQGLESDPLRAMRQTVQETLGIDMMQPVYAYHPKAAVESIQHRSKGVKSDSNFIPYNFRS